MDSIWINIVVYTILFKSDVVLFIDTIMIS